MVELRQFAPQISRRVRFCFDSKRLQIFWLGRRNFSGFRLKFSPFAGKMSFNEEVTKHSVHTLVFR
jgi:hypothetical protein